MPALGEKIERKAFQNEDAKGNLVTCIRDADLLDISGDDTLPVREIYIACMEMGITPLRYLRNAPSIRLRDQITLARSSVSVAGAGGLGGHVISLFTRLGMGKIRVFDPDAFDETNMNRQVFCTTKNLGNNKAFAAAEECRSINPAVDVHPHATAVTSTDQASLMAGSQVIIDALDNTGDRVAIADIARLLNIQMIHGAVAGFEGRMMTILPGSTAFHHLFSTEENTPKPVSAEQILGTTALAPAFIAPLQVMAALNILLNRKDFPADRMIHADLERPSLDIFDF